MHSLRWCLWLCALALVSRAGWGGVSFIRAHDMSALEFPDEEQYWLMARSLQVGEGLRDELGFTATRMPLYPAVLSVFAGWGHGIIAAKVLQWLVGAAAAGLAAAAAATLFNRRAGVIAGLLVAFDPFLVFFSSLLLTETAFLTALVALWWLLAPVIKGSDMSARRWLSVAVVAVVCVYLRESSVVLVALALGWLVICRRCQWRAVMPAAMVVGMVGVSLIPWAVRNRHAVGTWCWLTTRSGISLYDGVGPQADGSSNLGAIKQMPAVRGLDEVAWNRFFLRESLHALRADPARIVRLAGVKLGRMWNPVPNVDTYGSGAVRAVSAVWTIPTFVLALIGAALLIRGSAPEGWRIAVFLLLPALYLSALHSLFVGSVRYRLGAVPMLEMLAAYALVVLVDRGRKRLAAEGYARAD